MMQAITSPAILVKKLFFAIARRAQARALLPAFLMMAALAMTVPDAPTTDEATFCPETGEVAFVFQGVAYSGSGVMTQDGVLNDVYGFTAIGSDGSTVTGTFRISEVACAIADLTQEGPMRVYPISDLWVETYGTGG